MARPRSLSPSTTALVSTLMAVLIVGTAACSNSSRSQNRDSASNRSNEEKEQCAPAPRELTTPVELDKVTGVLYPGQYRGNEFKAHGGFRFDNNKASEITVTAPLDASLERASRYTQDGELQILLEFTASCNISYRFDHVAVVGPKLQSTIDALPTTSDTRTTRIEPPVQIRQNDVIATSVGMPVRNNVFVDFGLYDMTQPNKAAQNPDWLKEHSQFPHDQYGVCWFDWLTATDAAKVRALPAASQESGTKSDYCS